MERGYFYSKSTNLYVSREPLKIDARVIKVATDCGINLNWDDEGRINYITFYESLFLLQKLGATTLTMKDYWLVLRDAKEANDEDMVRQLQSDKYAEWLNTVFERKEYVKSDDIIAELKSWIQNNPKEFKELKFVTLSGLGEPTLNTCIGELIDQGPPAEVMRNPVVVEAYTGKKEVL